MLPRVCRGGLACTFAGILREPTCEVLAPARQCVVPLRLVSDVLALHSRTGAAGHVSERWLSWPAEPCSPKHTTGSSVQAGGGADCNWELVTEHVGTVRRLDLLLGAPAGHKMLCSGRTRSLVSRLLNARVARNRIGLFSWFGSSTSADDVAGAWTPFRVYEGEYEGWLARLLVPPSTGASDLSAQTRALRCCSVAPRKAGHAVLARRPRELEVATGPAHATGGQNPAILNAQASPPRSRSCL